MNDVKIGYKKYFEEELEREFILSKKILYHN